MSPRLSNIISFETFRSESAEWKRLGKCVWWIIVLPVLVMAVSAEMVAWRTGENLAAEAAAPLQAETHARWASFRDDNSVRFKLARAGEEQPEVLIMGASRMCQFRSEMFAPYRFYNLSRVSWLMNTYPGLLRHVLDRCHPRVIFIGVDFFTFNARYTTNPEMTQTKLIYRTHDWRDLLLAWRDSFVALCDYPHLLLSNGHDPDNGETVIGLHPNAESGGFRRDGSEMQGHYDLAYYHQTNRDMLQGNILNRPPLLFGNKMGKEEMAQFEEFAALARSRGIKLVAVQMPMYGPLFRYLKKDGRFGILDDFNAHVASGYFDKLGVTFFDYLYFPPYSDDPRYFMDAFHPTEPVSAAVLFVMRSDPRIKALLPEIDQKALADQLVTNFSASQQVYLYSPGN